jgi:hypothetical protein
MGISVWYRRISASLLNELIATHNSKQADTFFLAGMEDVEYFPKNLYYFDLGKDFARMYDLLNRASAHLPLSLQKLTQRGTPFDGSRISDEISPSLDRLSYLTAEDVRAIARAFGELDDHYLFRTYWESHQLDDPQKDSERRLFFHLTCLYKLMFCFFQIAAEAEDGMLISFG